MSKLLSVVIAAAFAAVSASAMAQTKDVKTKGDGAVKSKDGKAVVTKAAKEAPKEAPAPAAAPAAPKAKAKAKAGEVKTKDGAPVKSKDKKDVKTQTK